MNTYLVRLNGCPWFTVTLAGGQRAAEAAAYAVARGEQPPGVDVQWQGASHG